MEFSWNKWRQYIIQEASVNEADEFDTIGEITPFFEDAASMGIIKKVDAQRVMDAAGDSEDQDAFESTQEFQQIGKEIIMRAAEALKQDGRETHYLHTKFAQQKNNPVEGADIANAVNILSKSGGMSAVGMALPEGEEDLQNTDRGEDRGFSIYDLDDDEDLEENKFDKPGWDLEAIMNAFKEDFEEATMDTDDIPYAQSKVVDAYKDVFAKSHPQLAGEIDAYLDDRDRGERRSMFQNVADDPEVVGRDMMREFRDDGGEEDFGGDPQGFGNDLESRFQFIAPRLVRFPDKKEELKPLFLQMTDAMDEDDKVAFDTAFVKAMQIMGYGGMLEIEGEVQTEVDAFDEAMNDMAIEKAMTATKLDALQNDLEATLSQEEIDALSDAIVLLRKKENLGEALDSKDLDSKALINIFQALGNVEEEFGTKLGDKEAKTLSNAADIIKNLAKK